MGRNKKDDTEILSKFLEALEKFHQLKIEKWEKIDDEVQASNLPGTPTEDWINPPDETLTTHKLMKDPTYRTLRKEIEKSKKEALEIAHFFHFSSHQLEWLSFKNPLIGNAALEQAIHSLKLLIEKQKKAFYLLEKIKNWFNFN
jgi:ATP-dependent Lon protease